MGSSWRSPREARRRTLLVLALGFGLVVQLLLLGGYVGLENVGLLQESAANLARQQAAATAAIDRIQRSQMALRLVVYRLARGGAAADSQQIEALLEQSERDIAEALKAVQGADLEREWEAFRTAAREFHDEATRVLDLPEAQPEAVARLFDLQEDVMQGLRQLISAGHEASIRWQANIEQRSDRIRRQTWTLLAICLLIAIVVAWISTRVVTGVVREMQEQSEELGRVSGQLLERQETTARRFSHELHDELGQTLAAIKANLNSSAWSNGGGEARRTDCLHLTEEAIQNVRELSQLLHPTVLDQFGLDGALRWLAEGFGQRSGIAIRYSCDFDLRLSDEVRTHLFRIAQEALTNIARHSGATAAEVTLGGDSQRVELRIADNGRGLPKDAERKRPSLGLLGMRARARLAGGELQVQDRPGGGALVEVVIEQPKTDAPAEDPDLVGRRS